eukprot:ANDGO_03733.mRNA.1 hypothetical protein
MLFSSSSLFVCVPKSQKTEGEKARAPRLYSRQSCRSFCGCFFHGVHSTSPSTVSFVHCRKDVEWVLGSLYPEKMLGMRCSRLFSVSVNPWIAKLANHAKRHSSALLSSPVLGLRLSERSFSSSAGSSRFGRGIEDGEMVEEDASATADEHGDHLDPRGTAKKRKGVSKRAEEESIVADSFNVDLKDDALLLSKAVLEQYPPDKDLSEMSDDELHEYLKRVRVEKAREHRRKYYLANKERILAANAAYRRLHRDRLIKVIAEWRARNPESVKRSMKKYGTKHRDEILSKRRSRRALLLALSEPEQELIMYETLGHLTGVENTEFGKWVNGLWTEWSWDIRKGHWQEVFSKIDKLENGPQEHVAAAPDANLFYAALVLYRRSAMARGLVLDPADDSHRGSRNADFDEDADDEESDDGDADGSEVDNAFADEEDGNDNDDGEDAEFDEGDQDEAADEDHDASYR